MPGAAMQAPLSGLVLVMELTRGFPVMIPMITAAVTASVTARRIGGYSVCTARLRGRPVHPGAPPGRPPVAVRPGRLPTGDAPVVFAIAGLLNSPYRVPLNPERGRHDAACPAG